MTEDNDLKCEVGLVSLARDGNKEAFGKLVARLEKSVYALVLQKVADRDIASDLTQRVFLEAFRSLAKLRKPEKFRGWLYRLAARVCSRWLKTERRHQASGGTGEGASDVLGNVPEAVSLQPSAALEQKELQQAVLRALGELPEKYRIVVTLRYLEGMSAAEIARRLDQPEGSIRSRLFRAFPRTQAGPMGRRHSRAGTAGMAG